MSKGRPKALLVNPYIEDFAAYDHFSKPLGLITLASHLSKNFDLAFINALNRLEGQSNNTRFKEGGTGDFPKMEINKPPSLNDIPRKFKRYGIPESLFLAKLKNLNFYPDFIFMTSAMTYWYTGLQYTIRLIREVFPASKVIVGGIYASLLPEHAETMSGADYIVPYQDLESCLLKLEDITGEAFTKEYAVPAYELLNEYYYAPVLTSTGCVFHCTYCAGHKLAPFRQYDPVVLADMVLNIHNNYGTKDFAFYDDALLVNSENHIDLFLERLIKTGVSLKFYTPNGLHVRYLTANTARLMKLAGFTDIRLSLESIDSNFQKEKGDKTDVFDFRNKMELLKSAGFERRQIKIYTLLNVPGQSDSSVEETMRFAFECGGLPMLAFFSPIPGTPDFQKAASLTYVSEPLFQNNTVYLYRSGFDLDRLQTLKTIEKAYRLKA